MESTLLFEQNCRICLENETDDNDEMINPCRCSGTSKYVHRNCLNSWRSISTNPIAFSQCMECQYSYRTENVENIQTKFIKPCLKFYKWQLFIANNSCYFMILHYFMIVLLSTFFELLDTNKNIYKFFHFKNTTNSEYEEYETYFFLSSLIYITINIILFYLFFIYLSNGRHIFFMCKFFNKRIIILILSAIIFVSIFSDYLWIGITLLYFFQIFTLYQSLIVRRYFNTESSIIQNYNPQYDRTILDL